MNRTRAISPAGIRMGAIPVGFPGRGYISMDGQRVILERVVNDGVDLGSLDHADERPGICNGPPSTPKALTVSPG